MAEELRNNIDIRASQRLAFIFQFLDAKAPLRRCSRLTLIALLISLMKTFLVPLLAIAAVVSGVVGYQLGRSQAPKSDRIEYPPTDRPQVPSAASPQPSAADASHPSPDAANASVTTPRNLPDRIGAALAHDSQRRRAYEVERLFDNLTAADAPAILAALKAWPNSNERRGLLRPFFVRWAQLDGPGAVTVAKTFSGRERADTVSAAYAGWAKTDPYAAWDDAQNYFADASPFVASQARGVIDELAKHDLKAALSAIESLEGNRAFGSMFHIAAQAAFESNQMEGLLAHTLQLDDPLKRERWTSNIFARWGEADTEAPLDAMASISDPTLAKEAMKGFLQGWGRADEEGALSYALSNADNSVISEALGPLLQGAFMQGSKSDNRALVAQLSEANLIDKFAQVVVSGTSFMNPELAFDIAGRVSDADAKAQYRQQAISGWANADFEAARLQVEALPSAAERSKLIPSLMWQKSQRPEAGATLASLMESLPASPERAQSIESLLAQASNLRLQAHPSYLETLKTLSAAEPSLSDTARAQRAKLFGE